MRVNWIALAIAIPLGYFGAARGLRRALADRHAYPSGSLSSMDVLIRADPAPDPRTVAHSYEELSERKIHAIAVQVLTQTLAGAEDIVQE